MDIATFGDFNAFDWEKVPDGLVSLPGNGNQYFNGPGEYILDPTVPYECLVDVITSTQFSQTITFTSSFTPTSSLPLGRPAFRGGGNLGAAITLGWILTPNLQTYK